jgi:hypothetical protein
MHSNLENKAWEIHEVLRTLILQKSCGIQIQIHAIVLVLQWN